MSRSLFDREELGVSISLFLLLVLLSPWAMSFTPYPEIYRDGVYSGTYTQNSSYQIRASLITLGLLSAIAAIYIAIRLLVHGKSSGARITSLSMALACWGLGWRLYPYWVNGMFQAYMGNASVADFDPGALPPMIWISELWRIPVILFYPVGLLGSIGVVIAAGAITKGAWYRTFWFWAVMAAATVTLWSLVYSPRYGEWLWD